MIRLLWDRLARLIRRRRRAYPCPRCGSEELFVTEGDQWYCFGCHQSGVLADLP